MNVNILELYICRNEEIELPFAVIPSCPSTGPGPRSSRQNNPNSPANSQLTVPQRPQLVITHQCSLFLAAFILACAVA